MPLRLVYGTHCGKRATSRMPTSTCPQAAASISGVSWSVLREMPSFSWPASMRNAWQGAVNLRSCGGERATYGNISEALASGQVQRCVALVLEVRVSQDVRVVANDAAHQHQVVEADGAAQADLDVDHGAAAGAGLTATWRWESVIASGRRRLSSGGREPRCMKGSGEAYYCA